MTCHVEHHHFGRRQIKRWTLSSGIHTRMAILQRGTQTSSSRIPDIPADVDMASIESPRLSHKVLPSLSHIVQHAKEFSFLQIWLLC